MDIDFIKWLVSYADGFEIIIDNDGDVQIVYSLNKTWFIGFPDITDWVLYPPLLQRAIEGINRGNEYEVSLFSGRLFVTNYIKTSGTPFTLSKYETIDQAKEEALKYIWQEQENDSERRVKTL